MKRCRKEFFLGISHEPAWWLKGAVLLFTGAASGFFSGMMGVGGGGIMIPLMVLLAGMDQHLAQGTSLLVMVPVSIIGALTYYRVGDVRSNIVWGLTPGAVVGGYLGASAAKRISSNTYSKPWLSLGQFQYLLRAPGVGIIRKKGLLSIGR